jgi:hypothetical protein
MAVASYGTECAQPFECFSTLVDRHNGLAASFTEQPDYEEVWRLTKFTGSKPLDNKLWRKIRPTKSSLKAHVRSGVAPKIRRDLWLTMTQVKDEDVILYSHAIGQPDEVQNHLLQSEILSLLPCFSQSSSFNEARKRLYHHVLRNSTISIPHTCSLLLLLSHMYLHFLEEWECYVALQNILRRQSWIDRNLVEERGSIITLHKLLGSHLQSVDMLVIKPVAMGNDVYYNKLLSNWQLWPFLNAPFWIVVRLLDIYLIEGPKFLYRLAIVAVRLLFTNPICESYRASDVPLDQVIIHFLSTFTLEQRVEWVAASLSVGRFSSSTLFKQWMHCCHIAQESILTKEVFSSISVESGKMRKEFNLDSNSEILSKHLVDVLINWLPEWVLGDYLECIFKASKNGYNLRTLYNKCELEEYVILVIRTTKQSILGAFIASPLVDRHKNTFFGSGETILFTLEPCQKHYQWTADSDLILRANDEELIVGSGGGQYGLWIDGDLNRGSSATCSSYNNEPLSGTGEVDFNCSSIEVFKVTLINH